MKPVTVTSLFDSVGLGKKERIITLTDRMEPPEKNPLNDWLHYGISVLMNLSEEMNVAKAACVGTGQGNDAIAVSQIFHPQMLYATDIVEGLLATAHENIRRNTLDQAFTMVHGRDCWSLPKAVDLIFCNPPPLMKQNAFIEDGIVRTTLIEEEVYLPYAQGDPLKKKWSTLPLQGLLASARPKLTKNGSIVICYSGRIPFMATRAAFEDAGFSLRVRSQFLKMQTDPQFLAEYAAYERDYLPGDSFDFYDPKLIKGYIVPSLVQGHDDGSLKKKLVSAHITAQQGYELHLMGKEVCHVGYVLEGKIL